MPRNVREPGKLAQNCSHTAGDSERPGSGLTVEFTVTCTAQLFMFTGPLCKREPAFQKQMGDIENVTLNKLLLRVHCAEPTQNKVKSAVPIVGGGGGYDVVWPIGSTNFEGMRTNVQAQDEREAACLGSLSIPNSLAQLEPFCRSRGQNSPSPDQDLTLSGWAFKTDAIPQ